MNILSFGRNQKYYTPIRAFIDFIIGFIFSSIVLGYGLWLTPFMAPFCFGIIAVACTAIYFGRKWLGYGILGGLVGTFIVFTLYFISEFFSGLRNM